MKAILISSPGPPRKPTHRPQHPPPDPDPRHRPHPHPRLWHQPRRDAHAPRRVGRVSVPMSGIECVGTVDACPGGEFVPGTPVAAVMGYTVVRVGNVEGVLPWAELAALPESYCTAWTCLFRNLGLKMGQRLLIRGASSAFGRAALNLAVDAGAVVTATTRSEGKFAELKALGAADAVLEGAGLPGRLRESGREDRFDAVLELVGNSTVVESLTLVKRDGRLCLAGWLGGLDPIKDFNPLLQMASGVHFSFFGSFVFGTPDIVRAVADGKFDAKPFKVFKFDEIQEAHRYMEDGRARGKMVVVVD
ncbi:hypothetical protein C8A00DRAFT_40647 [Chaetomidium leptoderma]|uniref:Enoyl reductase (ER) domain-containing protein n=1 Tax=Chaetomidium leptoderma TaxID=669021 RepID=A0AAN6VSR8_9PEZI|nr:hypothetical protein C8A00DRAFT_40647 [Chaetomidium leptoderma]